LIAHGVNGLLADPRQPLEWTAAIKRLIDSPELAREIGQAGKRLAEAECDIKVTVQRLMSIYVEILGNGLGQNEATTCSELAEAAK
jgi:glycosyltransferase involved in cell wall biosynthesis